MNIKDALVKNKTCSLQIDEDLLVYAFSNNLTPLFNEKYELGVPLKNILQDLFFNDVFSNEKYFLSLFQKISNIFATKKAMLDDVVVSNNLPNKTFYHFSVGADLIHTEKNFVFLRFSHFEEKNQVNQLYSDIFDSYPNQFPIYEKIKNIGKFIIDFNVGKNQVYAEPTFAKLLDIPVAKGNLYLLTRDLEKFDGDNVLIRDLGFFKRTDLLINGTLNNMTDEWFYNDKWLHVDIQVLKRDAKHKPLYIGGVIYDITETRKQEEIFQLHSIYELAINVGRIGIFFYDIDKYGNKHFEANDIYAEMIGLDQKGNGYYAVDDFLKALLGTEEELQEKINILESLNMLLSGHIEGTDNQILKMKNLKTNNVFYVLSSSKIEERYENGDPKKLGGVIIDITERIVREKHQIEFASHDELTKLSNNRKLMKDMTKRDNGIGLFFDIDNFKKFNDIYGHQMGDKVLYEFAQALKENTLEYPKVYPYRLYGDEFFVFAEGYGDEFPLLFEKKLVKKITKRMSSFDVELKLEASMGSAHFVKGADVDDFMKTADYAMYETKIDKKKLSNKKT